MSDNYQFCQKCGFYKHAGPCPKPEPKSELAPVTGSDDLLDRVKGELYRVAAKLGELRDDLSTTHHACAWEISQTMRALGIAVETIERTKRNDPLPSVEEVQRIYRQNND